MGKWVNLSYRQLGSQGARIRGDGVYYVFIYTLASEQNKQDIRRSNQCKLETVHETSL